MFVDNDGDRAVLNSGWTRLESRRCDTFHDVLWHRSRGDIDFRDWHAQQGVAHRAAHDPRLFSIAIEYAQKTRQRATREPAGVAQLPVSAAHLRLHHFVVPGTNLPFSICAGT